MATMSDAERILRNLLDKIAADLKYKGHDVTVNEIPGDGSNITSLLYSANICAPDRDDIKAFAKVSNLGPTIRSKTPMARIFCVERYVYTELFKIYDKLQNKHRVPQECRLAVPEFYGCIDKEYEETIVLENLCDKGFVPFDRFVSIDWEFASKSVTELAKFHALSMAYGEEYPDEYNKVMDKMVFSYTTNNDDEEGADVWDIMMASALNAVTDDKRERLRKHIKDKLYSINKLQEHYRPIRRPVLCHGDYKSSNIMYKEDTDGKLEVVIVDYQTLQAGCPIMDLFYFIFNCSDEVFRGKYYEKLVEHYYTQLCLALQRLHLDPEKVYPQEDFEYELKEMLPFGLSVGVFTLQIVTVEAANAPKMDGDLTNFSVKTSDLFAERLNGIVNDYIRWGII